MGRKKQRRPTLWKIRPIVSQWKLSATRKTTKSAIPFGGGVEGDGFAIIANKGKGGQTVIHGVSNIDLACIIAGNDELMGASVIAKALREARTITEDKPSKILAGILGSIGK